MIMKDLIKQIAKDLKNAKNVVALTGAGISIESGIPPFRGTGGVWEKIDPELAHIDTFMKDPKRVWEVLLKDMKAIIDQAKPNDTHLGLAKLEQMGILKAIITQNVDGLHQMAGSREVIEFHGNFAWQRCTNCRSKFRTQEINLKEIPPKCPKNKESKCEGILRPDCVFFGEIIPIESLIKSEFMTSKCDIMLVIGTSALVQPAASMPMIAKKNKAKIIEINPESTPITYTISDCFVKSKSSEAINLILENLQE